MPFDRVVGHRHLLRLLARAVARDSLPPVLLFAGPDGVGKFTTAVALAEVLNCVSPVGPAAALPGLGLLALSGTASPGFEIDACGSCSSCRRLARAVPAMRAGEAVALDVLRVLAPDDKQSIKVGPVREVIAASAFRPFDGKRRLVIIDEADALEDGAQNALLKILEEPPSGTGIVLVTSRPDVLRPTITSRCPRLRFGPLTPAEIVACLVERHRTAPDAATALAAQADGSLGRALAGSRGDALGARDVAVEVLAAVATSTAPAQRLSAAQTLVSRSGSRDGRKATGSATRAQIADRLQAIGVLLRDLQVVSTRAGAGWLANADLATSPARLAGAFDGRRVARAFAAVDRAQFALERSVNHKALADWLAFEL